MIGLSVSRCIGDMARGDINPDFVSVIIAGTAHEFRNESEMAEQIAFYRDTRWIGCEDEAERLFREFWAAGKIEQPRLIDEKFPDVEKTGNHWVDSEGEIHWMYISP